MLTAINAFKLAFIILLGGLFFFGQGWIIVGTFTSRLHSITPKNRITEVIPLAIICGLIVNYAIALIVRTLSIGMIVGGVIAVAGLGVYIWQISKNLISFECDRSKWVHLAGIGFISVLFLGPILFEPLQEWDARSIWFFHGKMIYSAGTIGKQAGWLHPSVVFSHIDYPNLVPTIAAQIMTISGYWNEFLPKLSIFFMLIPAMFWLLSFERKSFSYFFLVATLLFGFYPWLWNGYMDGILALYISIAVLLLGRYIATGNVIDIISSVSCLCILPYLKNEGIPAALLGCSVVFVTATLKQKPRFSIQGTLKKWNLLLVGLIGILPLVLWTVYKQQWDIHNGLGIGSAESLQHILARIQDGSTKIILSQTFSVIEGSLFLLSLIVIALLCWKIPTGKEYLPALVVACLYCLGMILIYYLTPLDLVLHLETSIDRTMIPVNGCLFVVGYYILFTIERWFSKEKPKAVIKSTNG